MKQMLLLACALFCAVTAVAGAGITFETLEGDTLEDARLNACPLIPPTRSD